MEKAGRAKWVSPLFVSFSFGKGLNDRGGTRRAVALFGHDLGFLSVALRPAAGARRACLRTLKALLESKGRGRRRTVGLVAPGGQFAGGLVAKRAVVLASSKFLSAESLVTKS